jgi:hypothetical protein
MSTTTTGSGAGADPDTFVAVAPFWYATNLGGLVLNGVVAATTKRKLARASFWGGVALHVGEAAYAYVAANRAGFTRAAPKWALQTLAVGFPSLRALHAATRDA